MMAFFKWLATVIPPLARIINRWADAREKARRERNAREAERLRKKFGKNK